MRIIYNDKRLGIIRKKEIAQLRKNIKEIKKRYTIDNRDLRDTFFERLLSVDFFCLFFLLKYLST